MNLLSILRKIDYKCKKNRFKSFGEKSYFGPDCIFTCGHICVGNHTYIGPKCVFQSAHGQIEIGNHVMFGPGVHIHGGNHIYNIMGKYMDEVTKEDGVDGILKIEDDVWVGANAIILSGAYLSRGSIVGAGSLVRSKIPPYSIVVGSPCRVIGFRFPVDKIIEHEKILYPVDKRLNEDFLKKQFSQYAKQ